MSHSVNTIASKLLPLTGAPDYSCLQTQKSKRLFGVSRLPALRFLHCSGEVRIGKEASNKARHISGIPCLLGMSICSIRGPDGKRASVCAILHTSLHPTYLLKKLFLLNIVLRFVFSPVKTIQTMMMLMTML